VTKKKNSKGPPRRRALPSRNRRLQGTPAGAPDLGPVIVAVGGSAGSLSPLREFFASLPSDCNLAFVVVSHQAPSGKSLLPEILSKSTEMPVGEIADQTRAEPNRVYVAPRGYNVAIRGGVLALERAGKRDRPPLPIDFFFRSLALDRTRRAVGIVLSGTGTDGTLGLAAIRAEGGLSLGQAPDTAEFEGMPSSAIGALAADFVLAVAEMPTHLLRHARSVGMSARSTESLEVSSNEMERIVALIRVRGGHDFSAYKRETLLRRVHRRMDLQRIQQLADYARYLEQDDAEIDALWRDWLIGVSGFFRDAAAFQSLLRCGLSDLVAARPDGSTLRVWVPGCATGEEAYSLAIVLLETLDQLGKRLELQVFATDLDPVAIQTARAGRYPEGIAADVGPQRLKRFFVQENRHFRAKKALRKVVVFAVQNVLHDPPFTRVDLISCRNLLIYLLPPAQLNLLPVFHYSLNPGGLLLLGAGESVGGSEKFFEALDARWKVFRRSDSIRSRPPMRWSQRAVRPAANASGAHAARGAALDLADPLRRYLAERFGPPAVVVDATGHIQQIHGRVDAFLELPTGRANLNVVEMAREGLRAPLSSALREIQKSDAPIVERTARVKTRGSWLPLRLAVGRIQDQRLARPLLLVSFESAGRAARPAARKTPARSSRGRRADPRAQLEQELQHTRQDLQRSIDDLQSANEELASANEEVQSVNEELQSSNEELQTSKEETQSLNEELHTVNAELTQKLQDFEQTNDDLLNLIYSIEIATIFLDQELRVKRFTPRARNVARLIDADVGRPLADLALLIDYPDLLSDADNVLRSLQPVAEQACAPDGSWYDVRIQPYRTARNAIEGLVVTFVDITETKRAERTQAARVLAENVVDAVREPLLVLDHTLRVVRGNRSFHHLFRVEPRDTAGRLLEDLGEGQWSEPRLRELLSKTVAEGVTFDDFEVEREFPGLGRRHIRLNARPVSLDDADGVALILLGFEDVTQAPPS
jgi:two-component system, chemotaxis family, CheB/CheR fusion protein